MLPAEKQRYYPIKLNRTRALTDTPARPARQPRALRLSGDLDWLRALALLVGAGLLPLCLPGGFLSERLPLAARVYPPLSLGVGLLTMLVGGLAWYSEQAGRGSPAVGNRPAAGSLLPLGALSPLGALALWLLPPWQLEGNATLVVYFCTPALLLLFATESWSFIRAWSPGAAVSAPPRGRHRLGLARSLLLVVMTLILWLSGVLVLAGVDQPLWTAGLFALATGAGLVAAVLGEILNPSFGRLRRSPDC